MRRLSAWLTGNACKCMWGGGVSCMPGYALASHVRVSLSVYESLQQMPPSFLADHLTPLQPWIPPCVSGAGPWGEEWEKEAGGLGKMKRGSRWERLMEKECEGWGERWRMKADGPRNGGGGWDCRSVDWGDGEKNWVGKGLGERKGEVESSDASR